ncbi:MAG: hypothetical protein JKY86_01530 [Gammaproteobacteria bacterium]|nr:hypothetical protein [Gammaproteobacteria bacterium]
MENFLQELKRRKVFNVATFYVVGSWLILQVADTLFPAFEIPDSVLRLLVISLAAGFPVCLFITWAFDWTAQGLMITQDAQPNEKITLRSRDYATILLLLVLCGVVAVQQFVIYTNSLSNNEVDSGSLIRNIQADEGIAASLSNGVTDPLLESFLPNADMAIAILPLENLSPDPSNAYFAAGIHEEILNRIFKIGDIRVISRTTVLRYQDSELTLQEIARELNVAAIMEGSVRFANNRVRITIQLIRASDDTHLWSETYDFPLDDIFSIESDVALNVAEAMEATLLPSEIASIERQPTESTEAYTLFLQYRYQLEQENGRFTLDPNGWLEVGIKRLEEAIEIDPLFANGFAELGYLHWVKGQISPLAELAGLYDQSLDYVERALELDPTLSTAYETIGRVAFDRFQWEAWEESAARSIQLDDIDGRASFSFAMALTNVGRYEEAYAQYEVAMSTSPYRAFYREAAIAARIWGKDYQTALDMTDQYLAVGGDRNAYHAFRAYTLNRLGRLDESLVEFEQVTSEPMAVAMWVIPGYYDYLRCQQGDLELVQEELSYLPAPVRELRLQHCAAGLVIWT